MSPRAQLTDFPNNLIDDERLLSQREREMVSALLRHANNDAGPSAETRSALLRVIESVVGETVAQRAYGLLGTTIVRQLMDEGGATAGSSFSALTVPDMRAAVAPPPLQPQHPGFEEPRVRAAAITPPPKQPQPPGFEEPRARVVLNPPKPPGPQPPGFEEPRARIAAVPHPPLQPQPPREEPHVRVAIAPPRPPGPQPPGFEEPLARVAGVVPPPKQPQSPGFEEPEISGQGMSVAVMDAPQPPFRAAQCLVLDEFLVPAEVEALMRFALEKEGEFKLSEVVAPAQPGGLVDFDHRRSRVLFNIGEHEGVIVDRIKSSLPRILDKLNLDPFEISRVEAQMTASSDGDFFHQHTDSGEGKVATRELTFVYFFHREPKAFTGGELRIYDSVWKDGYYQAGENYRSIQPEQNQIVFFPSCLVHEITPIEIPSQAFADSRFTVNGWFRR